jgi:hypothetical protein
MAVPRIVLVISDFTLSDEIPARSWIRCIKSHLYVDAAISAVSATLACLLFNVPDDKAQLQRAVAPLRVQGRCVRLLRQPCLVPAYACRRLNSAVSARH